MYKLKFKWSKIHESIKVNHKASGFLFYWEKRFNIYLPWHAPDVLEKMDAKAKGIL